MNIRCVHALDLDDVESILGALSQGCLIVWTRLADIAPPDRISGLSHVEIIRASRFRTKQARSEFVTARSLVRTISGYVEGCSAAEIDIVVDPWGKPALGLRHRTDFAFSISHSAGYVAVAFAYGVDLGLDIELSRSAVRHLARHFLTRAEYSRIIAVSPTEQQDMLLRIWRAKEALLKAFGVGFFVDPRSIEVLMSLEPFHLGPVSWQDRIWHFEEQPLDYQADSVIAWSTTRSTA